jgi:rod shape-determining protein MreD
VRSLLVCGGWLAVITVAQTVAAPTLEIYHVKPDLFLISVIVVAMRRGGGSALAWGLAAGAVQDALSGGIIGFNLFSKPVTGFVVGLMRDKLDFANPNTQTVVTLFATLAEGAVLSVLLYAYHPPKNAFWTFTQVVIPLSVFNALVMPLVILAERVAGTAAAEWRRRESRFAQ